MKVAVLIPLFNHALYIREALASVAAQTRPADAVLIVDDGSTDGSIEAVRAFLADAPTEFRTRAELFTQENAGAHVALNRLVNLAGERGCDLVAILNSDDRFHPERLERTTAFLQENPATALVCTRLRLVDATGAPLPADHPRTRWLTAAWDAGAAEPDAETGRPDLPGWLGRANFAATTSNFVARTEWLRAHPFGNYRYAHDYAALLRAAMGGRLGVLDAELLGYRTHEANTISVPPELVAKEMLSIGYDLACELAPRLRAEPALRGAYARWRRAAWENVSLFPAGLFEAFAAEAFAQSLGEQRIAEFLAAPRLAAEFARPANSALADARARPGALAARCEALEAQLEAARADIRARAELRRLQTLLLGSRWFAVGRLLGRVRPLHQAGGKSAQDKLAQLCRRVQCSRWLAVGSRLGSSSATEIIQRSNDVHV